MIINVLDMLESSRERFSDKIAVKDDRISLTYAGLEYKAKRIGSSLAGYVESGCPVGVYMEKSADALCAFLGTVYSGGFYSMLNTELPDSRLQQIQSVLKAKIIVTSEELKDKAEKLFADAVIKTVSQLAESDIDQKALDTARTHAVDTDPLYVNFTSG